jgi:AMP phosphorylase
MKLKVKNFNLLAGKPVVFLNDKTAKNMNVFVGDRVILSGSHSTYATVDIFPGKVNPGQVGISKEVSLILGSKTGVSIEVGVAETSGVGPIIKKKIEGKELSSEELVKLMDAIVNNRITEAEIAYFIAAEKLSGMSTNETIALTKAMVKTGASLKFKGKYIADKHCIGGVAGNRTTPIVVAICAVAGLTLPKTSSRAITSAAGTADVIETISNIEFPIDRLKKIVNKVGASLAWGGSLGLAPSDDKIIHVERLLNLDVEPQLLASIMSKKISAGAKYLLIDIPYGKGSKVKSRRAAEDLGAKFRTIYKAFKIKTIVVYTNGSQPIGNGFGPTLEMYDVLGVLDGEGPRDLKLKSLYLASELMTLCGIKNAEEKSKNILESGQALEKFKEIINAQNNKKDFDKRVGKLSLAKIKHVIKVPRTGRVSYINNRGINSLCRILGTPETDGAGAYLHHHLGRVKKGDPLITLYTENKTKMKNALKFFKEFKPIEIK